MALKWVEGFESYSNLIGQMANRYQTFTAPTASFQPGRAIGNCLQMNGTVVVTPTFGNHATWVVGFAFKNVNLSNTNTNMVLVEFRDSTTSQVNVTFNPSTKVFAVYRGASVIGTGTTVASTGSWYYVECKILVNSSTGTAALHVNGNVDVNLSSLNTQVSANAYANTIAIKGPAASSISGAYQIDDVYILDGSGAANNTFLGDMKVEAVRVIEAGNYAAWTPNIIGTPNFECVQVLADGLFVESNTSTNKDSYICSHLNKVDSNIAGVQAIYWARNTDSTQHQIDASVRISGTDYFSSAVTITDTAFKAYQHIWEEDPSTSAAWIVSGVNDAEFGQKLV